MAELLTGSIWQAFLDAEPAAPALAQGPEQANVALAFSRFVDMKSVFTLEHSAQVARPKIGARAFPDRSAADTASESFCLRFAAPAMKRSARLRGHRRRAFGACRLGTASMVPPSPRLGSFAVLLACGAGCAAPEVRSADDRASVPAPTAPPAARGDIAEPVVLELIDDFNPPRPPPDEVIEAPGARWDAALGGLSGLDFDAASATLYAISDLPRDHFAPRLYSFGVTLTDSALRVEPKSVALLHERDPAARARVYDLDPESITGDGHGAFYIGTENGFDRPTQTVPRILRMNQDGLITAELELPPAYLPGVTGDSVRGTRSNEAFEGITRSPSGRWLIASVESTLHQDGDPATFEHGASVRLLRWELGAAGIVGAPHAYFYPIEPLPRPARGTPKGGNNGVAELVCLDDRRLLVLERAYVPLLEGQGPNTIRIFEVSLPEALPPAGAAPQPLEKRLVLDLGDILAGFDPGAQTLDNMEGMTIGPDLPNGDASLLLVTDDNFRKEQRTMFLALRMKRVGG